MIDFSKAIDLACKYYENNLNIKGLARALEDNEYWYFSGGTPGEVVVGSLIISVKKSDGKIEIVEMPSHESIMRLKKAKEVEIKEVING